jgi:hypothetical protein
MQCTRKSLNVALIARKVQTFFDEAQMDLLARQTGFVQRSSRLTGLGFVQALVFGYLEHAHASLTQLASVCADLAIEISPQGLDARLQTASVRFLQAVLAQALRVFQSHLPLPLAILAQFSAVYIVDSSVQALPAALQADYPGCGGGGPVASLKIQLVFDFLCGNLRQIALQAGRSADQAYRDYLALLQPGCLILADLGYFCLDAWQAICACPAFFLSRYLYPTALFGADGERLEAPALLRRIHAPHFEQEVHLGRRQRLAAGAHFQRAVCENDRDGLV